MEWGKHAVYEFIGNSPPEKSPEEKITFSPIFFVISWNIRIIIVLSLEMMGAGVCSCFSDLFSFLF